MSDPLNRRDFIRFQMKGALWLTAGASGMIAPTMALADAAPDLGVAKGKPGPAARAAVELLGGMKRFVKKGQKVVIKPNMSFDVPPERGSNTHPEVVRELAVMCKEAGASRVLILDNPLAPEERCLETSGIKDACETIDDNMVFMVNRSSNFREAPIPNGVSLKKTDVMKQVLESDVLIAAPVAKSHSGAGVSMSMKGMMGLILNRGIMHRGNLQEEIADLASLLTPDLTVIDGTRVLSTGGPRGPGKVLKKDTVIASADMVAADALAVASFEWYGRKVHPSQVRHIRIAHERGLGRMDVENLRIKSVSV